MTSILITGGAGYIASHVAWQCLVMVIDDLSTGSFENVPSAAVFRFADLETSVASSLDWQRFSRRTARTASRTGSMGSRWA